MKSLDLNKSENLIKLKNEIATILENRIAEANIENTLGMIENLPFGTVKNLFESVSDKLYSTPNGKKIIGRYVKTIRENKDLQAIYGLHETISKPTYIENPQIFISEAISISKKINPRRINEGKDKVCNIVKSALKESHVSNDDILSAIDSNKPLNEAMEYIFTNKCGIKNLSEYSNNVSTVFNYLKESVGEKKETTENEDPNALFKELNENILKNNGLEEWENLVLMDIVECNLANRDEKTLFESYKNSCILAIDKIIGEEASIEEKNRLSTMKMQLESKRYSKETLSEDLLKLSKLKKTLSE